jgi:hypothetical protein
MKRSRRLPSLNYGTLAPRKLLAGDVTVAALDNLFIRGDDESNQIQIVATDSGEVEIIGLHGTTINGSEDPFTVPGTIDLDGARTRNAAIDGGLRIDMKGGHDRIDIRGLEARGDSWISMGDGDDFARFFKSTAHGDLRVLTGEGDDKLRLFQARAVGDLNAFTSDGNDEVLVWNSRVWQDVMVQSGAGHDDVTVKHTRFTGGYHHVMTWTGNDKVDLARNLVNESGLIVEGGDGNDRVFAQMASSDTVLGTIRLSGQKGSDAISMTGSDEHNDMLVMNGFEEDAGEVVFDQTGAYDYPSLSTLLDSKIVASTLSADYFVLDQDATISTVDWRGSYSLIRIDDVPAVDDFTIKIYENTFIDDPTLTDEPYNAPELEPFATYEIGNAVTRTATGKIWTPGEHDPGPAQEIYEFSAEIEPIQLEAGKRYWISIYANVEGDGTGNYDYLYSLGAEDTGELNRETAYSRLYAGLDYWYTSLYASSKFDFKLRS